MTVAGRTELMLLERARETVGRGEWAEGFRLLTQLDAERGLDPAGLDLLGQAAYGAGEFEAAITAWERLHDASVAAGDHLAAAGAAATVAMYLMMDTGLMAPVRSWVARAERLLDGHDEHPSHALLAMVRTYERFLSGDVERARHWAPRAIEVGARQGVAIAVALGTVASARLLIVDGDVDAGIAALDEAAVSLVSSELGPLEMGMVYCELICAMQGLAEYERSEEWTAAMDRWRLDGGGPGGVNGRCRVHRAEILRLRGSCEEAEDEALHACDELRPWMRREFGWPLTELGTIRLRRGDLAGAREAFLAAHEHGWDPHPGLALLHLAEGQLDTAAALIAGALDRPFDAPWKERPPRVELTRASLLDAQAEIAVAAGDVATAGRAASELTAIAEVFRSRALGAVAALARARVALAGGDVVAAISEGDVAVSAWCEVGAPYEAAAARLVVAEALGMNGDRERAELELAAARRAFERIGAHGRVAALAGSSPAAGERPAGERPATSATSGSRAPTNVFRLDGDTRTIAFAGSEVLLRDLKGFRYLARLLGEPGREFHVLDLAGVGAAPRATTTEAEGLELVTDGGLGPALDEQARAAYRRRLVEIDEDIEEATRHGDTGRVALATADRDYLVGELTRAFGLGGRARPVGATSERARASVTRAIRYALARIAEHHAPLAEHLELTVSTGVYCRYAPDPRVPAVWVL